MLYISWLQIKPGGFVVMTELHAVTCCLLAWINAQFPGLARQCIQLNLRDGQGCFTDMLSS